MKLRRVTLLLLLLALLLPSNALAGEVPGFAPDIRAESQSLRSMRVETPAAILVDDSYQRVLFSHNAHARRYPASITKVMTALLTIQAVEEGTLTLDQTVIAPEDLYTGIGAGASSQGIKSGEAMTVQDLLYCALIPSANEACNILASAVSGDIPTFVKKMNQEAARLGMSDTHFANTHGYHDDGHYTTAYDIYLMSSEAMRHPLFRQIVSCPSYTVPATNLCDTERILRNTNYLLSEKTPEYYLPDAVGIKTGSTPEAGLCLASAAARDGRTVIAVVLGGKSVRQPDGTLLRQQFDESRRLLEWGLDNFSIRTITGPEEPVGTLAVTLSKETDSVELRPTSALSAFLPNDLDPSTLQFTIDCPESVEAPVEKGQVLGALTISSGDEVYGTLELAASNAAARSLSLFFADRASSLYAQPWVKALMLAALVGVFLLVRKLCFSKPAGARAKLPR